MKKVTISFLVKDAHDQAELDRTMNATKFYLTLVELSQFLRQGRKYGHVGRLKLDNLLKTENGQELFDEVEEAFYEILKENNINSLSEYDG
jgi:site-specific recombinase